MRPKDYLAAVLKERALRSTAVRAIEGLLPKGEAARAAKMLSSAAWPRQATAAAAASKGLSMVPRAPGYPLGFSEQVRKTLRRVLDHWNEQFRATMPPNWRGLETEVVWRIGTLMTEKGWCLAWTPPANVLRDVMVASTDDERKAILVTAEASILADLDRLLADRVREPETAEVRGVALEAVETYRGGQFRAAQALAAAAITTAMHENLGHRRFDEARRELAKLSLDRVDFRLLRVAVVLGAVRQTIMGYDPRRLPRNFNRMATVHHVREPQHSQANALTALMLLVGLLVELDELTRRQLRPQQVPDADLDAAAA